METQSRRFPRLALLAGALLATTAIVATATPRIQTGPTAEVTADGLHRVDGGTFDRSWAKPGVDLSGYTKILLRTGEMGFREMKDPGYRRDATNFPIDDEQRQWFEQTIREAFVKELGNSQRFALIDQPGPGVLEIYGAIVDVVSHVPEDPIGRSAVLLKSLGEATLIVELRDSVTHKVLARAVDRRAAQNSFPTRSNSVTNRSDIRFAAESWASLLRRRLDEFGVL